MQIVANHLFDEVQRRIDLAEKNWFGRSAFNRCYYATFLNVRDGLKRMNPKWSELPHKDIPEVLKGTIRKEFSRGKTKASKVSDWDTMHMCQRAATAALELSDLMTKGYATRIVADYYPEILISIDASPGHECFLNSIGAKEAQYWSSRSEVYVNEIVSVWSQIND